MEWKILKERPFYLSDEKIKWIKDTLFNMDLEQKVGQLFCALGDAYSPEELRELIEDYGIGAVLFRPDFNEKVRQKYVNIEKYARIPLLKAANLEEGGAGVDRDATYFGSQMQIAAANDYQCTENFAKICAVEGRNVGVNWSFSPVVDIDYNYRNPITNVRTFGNNPDIVLENARRYVATLQKSGVAAACKHFPGDGVDYRDQHLHPTYNSLVAEEWYATYGRIYKELIAVDLLSIMVGHIVQPAVIRDINPSATEKDLLPASLSRELITGVLREKYNFNGVVITDATIMGGYCMAMERKKAIPTSISVGCDMLCFSTDLKEDISYVLEGIQSGILTEERLDEAVMHILALKAKMLDDYPSITADAAKWQRECADKAITLIKDNQKLVPVSKREYSKIQLVIIGNDETGDGSLTEIASKYLQENGFDVEKYQPLEDDLHGTQNLQKQRLNVILANFPTESNQTTVRISWCPKHALEMPRFVNEEKYVFISFANPYHLQDIPRVKTYINAYSATKATIIAALEKLIGKSEFQGVSPVDAYCGLEDTYL